MICDFASMVTFLVVGFYAIRLEFLTLKNTVKPTFFTKRKMVKTRKQALWILVCILKFVAFVLFICIGFNAFQEAITVVMEVNNN